MCGWIIRALLHKSSPGPETVSTALRWYQDKESVPLYHSESICRGVGFNVLHSLSQRKVCLEPLEPGFTALSSGAQSVRWLQYLGGDVYPDGDQGWPRHITGILCILVCMTFKYAMMPCFPIPQNWCTMSHRVSHHISFGFNASPNAIFLTRMANVLNFSWKSQQSAYLMKKYCRAVALAIVWKHTGLVCGGTNKTCDVSATYGGSWKLIKPSTVLGPPQWLSFYLHFVGTEYVWELSWILCK